MKAIFTSRFHENQASIDNCLIQLLILNQDYQLSQLLILNGTRKKKKKRILRVTVSKWQFQLVMQCRNMMHRKIGIKGSRYSSFHDKNYTTFEASQQCFFLQYQYQLSHIICIARTSLLRQNSPHFNNNWANAFNKGTMKTACNSAVFQSICLMESAASIVGEFAFRSENFNYLLPKLILPQNFPTCQGRRQIHAVSMTFWSLQSCGNWKLDFRHLPFNLAEIKT